MASVGRFAAAPDASSRSEEMLPESTGVQGASEGK